MNDPQISRNAPLVEHLTERELDVLRLKAKNRSNQEIADELVLALSTVKFYVRQIYGKLGVENKYQATARAQALGIIEGTPAPGTRPRHNLPAQTTPFIGREQELADLNELLADPAVRLITILAPGGMGKTRLGLALADAHRDRFADGVYMVPLAPLREPDQIVTAIAEASYFPFSQDGRSAQQQVLDFLRNKHMLLVLDNFEHLLDGAEIVIEILQAAPAVQIVVTSRERLHLSGEAVYTVGGMIFPDWETPEDALEYDAVKLFMQRAELVSPGFELHPDDLRYLARICRLVEGMPLGIVLAAAWIEVLSLAEIADEIQGSFDFLAAEMRDVPRRQWSIRAVFEPTWDRLTDSEHEVFMRFSVFRGGATRAAAQAVTGANLRTLQALINRALLDRDATGRYQMHELLRQYAEQQLIIANQDEETYGAHSAYFLGFLRDREEDVKGQRQYAAMHEIDVDFDNVRVAWQWVLDHRDDAAALHQAAVSLGLLGEFGGRGEGVRSLFRLAQERFRRPGEAVSPGWVHLLVCHPGNETLSVPDQMELARQSLAIARQYNDAFLAGCALCLLRTAAQKGEAPPDMPALHADALAHWRTLDDQFGIGWMLNQNAIGSGYRDEVIELLEYAVEINRTIGNKIALSVVLCNLGYNVAHHTGNVTEAKHMIREALDLAEAANSTVYAGLARAVLGHLCVLTGDFEEARTLSGMALASAIDLNHMDYTERSLSSLAMLAGLEGDYDEARQLCEQMKSLTRYNLPFAAWIDTIVACGLSDYQAARLHLPLFLEKQITNGDFVRAIMGLPIAAILRGHSGDPSGAAELLSLAFTHPQGETGWMERWDLLTQLRADLEADLGADAYRAAWERGAALDLETVIADLLVEMADEEESHQ